VEWQLSLLLKSLLLGRNLAKPLDHDTLGKQFFLTTAATNFLECILCIINQTFTEGTQSNLDKRPIVQDL
jgi:hypothetical protein